MRTRKIDGLVEYKLRCLSCDRDQHMTDMANLNLGDEIHPGVRSHRNYGRCIFCRKPGLKIVDRSDLRAT